jgi:hypothetical protein
LRDLEPIGEALWKNVAQGRYRRCRIRSPRWIGAELDPPPLVAVPFDMRLKPAGRSTHDIALAVVHCLAGFDGVGADFEESGDRLVVERLRRSRQQLERERPEFPRASGV